MGKKYRLVSSGQPKSPVNLKAAVKAVIHDPKSRVETEEGQVVLSLAALLTADLQSAETQAVQA